MCNEEEKKEKSNEEVMGESRESALSMYILTFTFEIAWNVYSFRMQSKHEKAVVGRKGPVREIRKPSGTYGGEASCINAGISRSIRFKS